MKKRLPRKVKKEMKKKYQEVDDKFNIVGSLYDGFTWKHYQTTNNVYYGKIQNWKDLKK